MRIEMSAQQQLAGYLVLAAAGVVAITWFISWLVTVPHEEIQTDFDTLKRKER